MGRITRHARILRTARGRAFDQLPFLRRRNPTASQECRHCRRWLPNRHGLKPYHGVIAIGLILLLGLGLQSLEGSQFRLA